MTVIITTLVHFVFNQKIKIELLVYNIYLNLPTTLCRLTPRKGSQDLVQ